MAGSAYAWSSKILGIKGGRAQSFLSVPLLAETAPHSHNVAWLRVQVKLYTKATDP